MKLYGKINKKLISMGTCWENGKQEDRAQRWEGELLVL